jgi:acetyltransferase
LMTVDSARKKYTSDHKLRNGVSVVFRPIECTDKERFREFFGSLSPASVHFRFFEIIKELPRESVERLCHVDYGQEMAIVALPQDDSMIIAVARLVLDADRMRGEFALTIADAWQGYGLGSELLSYLIAIAKDYGLEEIHCFVTSDNPRMIALAKKKGLVVKSSEGDTLEMALQLM